MNHCRRAPLRGIGITHNPHTTQKITRAVQYYWFTGILQYFGFQYVLQYVFPYCNTYSRYCVLSLIFSDFELVRVQYIFL